MVTPERMTAEQRFRELFDRLDDAIVEFRLVNEAPYIVQVNRAFTDVFGFDNETAAGRRLNELIVPAGRQTEAQAFDRRTAAGKTNAGIIERRTTHGMRQFMYRSIPCPPDRGFAIYSDVTEKLRRDRHLGVLQRVLRHNLRNDLNLVLGMAETVIADAESDDVRAAGETIKETASELVRLSEEAKILKQVLEEPTALRTVELDPLVADVVAEYQTQHPQAQLTHSSNANNSVAVVANERIATVVQNLVDNAIRHNTSDTPQVAVDIDTVGDTTVELSVSDNGPGIPQAEQEIILGDAEITPLTHGSGLGLWLVKWITESYDSSLSIETPDGGGTVIRIQLARAAVDNDS